MSERRWHHWVHLNDEGKNLYGEIYPDGIVPVKIMFSQGARLEGQQRIQRVYKIDWEQLTEKQKDLTIKLLSAKFGAEPELIRHQFESDGFIPLRDKYVSGVGTDQMGLFI